MKIIFFYDYICPFCYIGSRRIIKIASEYSMDIEWRPIEIHPEYTSEGKKRKKSLRSKHILQTLKDVAKDDNTEIELPGFVTNSRLCLESSVYAKEMGEFMEFHNNVYSSYFGNKVNIGKVENVLKIAEDSGLDPDELYRLLKERRFKKSIEENQRFADENMVLGVPTVYINELRIHGTQSMEVYRNLIEKELKNSKTVH